MVHQTTVENGRRDEPAELLGRSVSDLKSNLISLAELQLKLLGADLQAGLARTKTSAVLLVIALTLMLGAVPVGLAALAWGIDAATELGLGWSLAISAGAGAVVAIALAWYAFNALGDWSHALDRSREEFAQNVRYVKTALHSSTRTSAEFNDAHRY